MSSTIEISALGIILPPTGYVEDVLYIYVVYIDDIIACFLDSEKEAKKYIRNLADDAVQRLAKPDYRISRYESKDKRIVEIYTQTLNIFGGFLNGHVKRKHVFKIVPLRRSAPRNMD